MRTESEMMEVILETAKAMPEVLGVYMNGSRTNPHVPKDQFQDYDVVYVVRDIAPLVSDESWLEVFGNPLYMQRPEVFSIATESPREKGLFFAWLIQYSDGVRLDLTIQTIEATDFTKDQLCRILIDKNHYFPCIEASNDQQYHVKQPSEAFFLAVCNEFWWCLNNVAKGLWRDEIPYVMDMLSEAIRPQLIRVLSWQVGLNTDFSVSVGKSGKYLKNHLSQNKYNRLLATYPSGHVSAIWDSVFIMCDLFNESAIQVSQSLYFPYNETEANNSYTYLKSVYHLPQDNN